ELLNGDLDTEDNIDETSDGDYNSDDDRLQRRDGGDIGAQEISSASSASTSAATYQFLSFQIKSDGSNQENVCLTLKFLLQRNPELMEEPPSIT
ncbi:hypothetical protein BGX23_002125, partial [Mortierella sp. AD031]